MRTTTTRYSGHKSYGQNIIEFALLLPFLVLLIMGTFDFMWAVYAKNTITNAAREGVRVAIIASKDCDAIRTRVNSTSQSLRLAREQISISPDCNPIAPFHTPTYPVTVSVQYTIHPITPLIGLIWDGFVLRSSSTMIVE